MSVVSMSSWLAFDLDRCTKAWSNRRLPCSLKCGFSRYSATEPRLSTNQIAWPFPYSSQARIGVMNHANTYLLSNGANA